MHNNTDNAWTSDTLGRGDVAAVMRRVREDPGYLASRDFVGDTPLLIVIGFGDARLVEFMLRHGADPSAEVDGGYTPLLAAVESEQPASAEIVARLIDAGADIHARVIDGGTLLHVAAAHGNTDKARLLIDAGARVDERNPIEGAETPLMEAARQGHPALVRLLIDRGADPSLRDATHGRTALEMARCAATGADPEVFRSIKAVGSVPIDAGLLANLDVPPEMRETVRAMFAAADMAERYRRDADRLARDGDHDGVIRVLEAFEGGRNKAIDPRG